MKTVMESKVRIIIRKLDEIPLELDRSDILETTKREMLRDVGNILEEVKIRLQELSRC